MAEKPVAVGKEVRVERVINFNFTVDHRYIDGGRAARMIDAFMRVFSEPEAFIRKNFKPELVEK